jgi:hypothetical protein
MMDFDMAAKATLAIKIDAKVEGLPTLKIDEAAVHRWIGNRLNGARNRFIRAVSAGKPNPSRPGEYPRTDTGRLVNSVHIQMIHWSEGSLRSDVEYAEYLTRGTRRMAPRKMLREALDEEIEARPETDELAKAAEWETPAWVRQR